jgi:hypothetical protein
MQVGINVVAWFIFITPCKSLPRISHLPSHAPFPPHSISLPPTFADVQPISTDSVSLPTGNSGLKSRILCTSLRKTLRIQVTSYSIYFSWQSRRNSQMSSKAPSGVPSQSRASAPRCLDTSLLSVRRSRIRGRGWTRVNCWVFSFFSLFRFFLFLLSGL